MVIEYVRYRLDPDRVDDLVAAYGRAAASLRASSHCRGFDLARGVEEPGNLVLRIEWDSVEGHEQGFRRSPEFREFLREVRPFVADLQEMRHYAATDVGWQAAQE